MNLFISAGSFAEMLRVPSRNPIWLRGVSSGRKLPLKPICAQRMLATPDASFAMRRTAVSTTWGLSAHACTDRSPPVRPGTNWSPANRGRSTRACGRCAASPKRSTPSFSNKVGPNPKVIVRRETGRPTLAPGSSAGKSRLALGSRRAWAWVILAAASVHALSNRMTSARSFEMTSKATKYVCPCIGVSMPD